MVDAYINCKSTNKQLKAYMFSYLDIITTISSIMLIRANTEESLQKKKELLEYIRTENKQVYRKLRHSLFGRVMNLPGRGGRKMSVAAYKISQKFYGFNWCVKASHSDIGFGKIFYEIVITVKSRISERQKCISKILLFFKSF